MAPWLSLWTLLLGLAIFFLPGYALLSLIHPRINLDPIERFSLGLGLSLAVIPLSLYITTLLRLRQGPSFLIVFLILAGAMTAWDLYRRWRASGFEPLRQQWASILAFTIIALAALLARLQAVAGLDFPLWTDSYHHTLIAQIIADSGRVPASYEPYAPIHNFTYHFGFHSLVAWFHWLARIPIPRSVVIVGQSVNALVVPTVYVLAKRLWKRSLIGIAAGLIVGLFSHMPAFFVNWGRYTQLTGQMLFPIVLAIYMESLDREKLHYSSVALVSIGLAGLFLTHNRMTLFFLLFGGLYLLIAFLRARAIAGRGRRLLASAAIILILAGLIDLPWIINFSRVFGVQVLQTTLGGYQEGQFGGYYEWTGRDFLTFGSGLELWMLALLGWLVSLFRGDRQSSFLLLGSSGLLLVSLSYRIGIPPPFSILIVILWLHVPVALLGGYFVSEFGMAAIRRWGQHIASRGWPTLAALALLAGIALPGIAYLRGLTLPENGFVREADLRAMRWIRENISEDARFYIAIHFWTPEVAHGLDAGYWIPYLAGRETVLPPQLYKSDGTPTYARSVNARARRLAEASDILELHALLKEYDITHIYIGERPTPLEAKSFKSHPSLFHLLYEDDGVHIFEVLDGDSSASTEIVSGSGIAANFKGLLLWPIHFCQLQYGQAIDPSPAVEKPSLRAYDNESPKDGRSPLALTSNSTPTAGYMG